MKKRLLLCGIALTLVLSFCACSASKNDTSKNSEYSDADILTYMSKMAKSLQEIGEMDAEELSYQMQYIDYYVQQKELDEEKADIEKELLTDWYEVAPVIGKFVGYKDFKVDKAGKTITASLVLDYSKRDAKLIYVFNANTMDVEAMNIELVYSLGETMAKAGVNTIMGISVVFCILVIISLIIYCFKIIPVIQKRLGRKNGPSIDVMEGANMPMVGRIEDSIDDKEIIAVIAAAISAATGTSMDNFVVRSVKRRND